MGKPQDWKPGQSGNLKGRPPKGYSITEMMKAMLKKNPEVKKKLGQKILALAMKGDLTAIKTLWSYMDGMPVVKGEIDANVTVNIDQDLKKNE